MHITKAKKDFIRRHYISGKPDVYYLAEKLELCTGTIRFYLNEFRVLEAERPDKLHNFSFFIGKEKVAKATPWYKNCLRVMPELVAAEAGPQLIASQLYRKYQSRCPEEYSQPHFYYLFKRWFNEHEAVLSAQRLKEKFTPENLATLQRWRKSNDWRLWQVSVALMTTYTYNTMKKLARRIECTYRALLDWLRTYEKDSDTSETIMRSG